jgi:hypothetical protein
MATAAPLDYTSDQAFYRRMAVGLALFIIFGFAQFSARGYVNFGAIPVWVHLHALVFVGWLALFVTQNLLAERGSLALHRRLGWWGAGLAALMVVVGSFTAIKAIELGREPPFFSPPYFLALTQVGVLFFAGLVAAAILRRRDTEWHRRLMLSATVLLLEPALGRLLPMPLIGGETGEWYVLVLQLAVLGFCMRHDRKARGRVHPALLWGAGAIVVCHLVTSGLSKLPAFVVLAQSMAPTA